MEYPEGCSTAMRHVVRKVATMEDRLVWLGGGFTVGTLFPDRWTCIWQMFYFMRAITFNIFEFMCMTCEHYIVPFPTVLVLWYTWVHVYTPNCHDMASYVEIPINKTFGFGTALSIPNIDPNYYYVWFQGGFDNSRFGYKDNIIEDMSRL